MVSSIILMVLWVSTKECIVPWPFFLFLILHSDSLLTTSVIIPFKSGCHLLLEHVEICFFVPFSLTFIHFLGHLLSQYFLIFNFDLVVLQ